jgi:hypothetical protein
MRVNRRPFLRNMWKTWKTRNFAGFPASGHIPGIGRWCSAKLAPAADGRGSFLRQVFAMSARDISILAFAIGIGPSLVYASPACMTETDARAKFPKELFIRTNIAGTLVRPSGIRHDTQQAPHCLRRRHDAHSRERPCLRLCLRHGPNPLAMPSNRAPNVDIRHASSTTALRSNSADGDV